MTPHEQDADGTRPLVDTVRTGRTALGIELGSTRIKACLVAHAGQASAHTTDATATASANVIAHSHAASAGTNPRRSRLAARCCYQNVIAHMLRRCGL